MLNKSQSQQEVGCAVMIFGSRHPEIDFLYREELEAFKAGGALTELHTAFSRAPGAEKVYYHDIVLRNGEKLGEMICQDDARV